MSPLKLNGSTSGFVALDAPAAAGSNTLVLPTGNGSNGQVLTTNGSGTLSWSTIAASQWTTTGSDIYYNSGKVLVGASASRSWLGVTSGLQVESTSYNNASVSQTINSNDSEGVFYGFIKSRGTSNGSNTIVQNNDNIANIYFTATDGNAPAAAARIQVAVDGTPGSGDMPGRLVFYTTPDGSSTPTERMRIDSSGYVTIYKNSSNLARLNFEASSTRLEYSDATGHLSFYTNSSARVRVNYGGSFVPVTDNSHSLGTSSERWTAVYAVNGTIQTSDLREKTEVTPSVLGSDFIKQLRPVSYKWNVGENVVTKAEDGETDIVTPRPGERTHWGFIAQEVKEAVDNAGVDFGGWVLADKDDPNSMQGLRYDQFIAPLTKALQEALGRIETLEANNAALEARLSALEVTP